MKTMKKYLSMAALALVGAIMTGCSSSDDDSMIDNPQQPESKSKVVTLTTKVGFDGGATTRALTSDGTKTFAAGEKIAVIYTTNGGVTAKAVSEALQNNGDITDGGKSATFTVTLNDPNKSAEVTYIYPAAMANTDGSINNAALNSQDGTLATLSSNLDLATYTGDWNAGALPTGTLTNQLAILAITLKDNATPTSYDITGTITGMTISDGTNNYAVSRSAVAGPIYVAIKPTSSANIQVTATNSTTNYTKSLTGKTYAAGNGYNVSWRMHVHAFTINASGDKVYFSKGNLRATTTDLGAHWTWAFAEHQWDKVGDTAANTSITANKTVSTNGTVDLFGWSTDATYLGINKTNNNNAEFVGTFKDWGEHDDVIANIGSGWRTLFGDEWYYLFINRSTTSGKYFCKAKVGDCFGVILLPDDWSTDYYTLNNCNETDERNFDDTNINNKISTDDWTSKLEAHGAVFLPCAGQRNGGNVVNAPNGQVHYWSASKGTTDTGSSANANHVRADGNGVAPNTGAGRANGFSVRLVHDFK